MCVIVFTEYAKSTLFPIYLSSYLSLNFYSSIVFLFISSHHTWTVNHTEDYIFILIPHLSKSLLSPLCCPRTGQCCIERLKGLHWRSAFSIWHSLKRFMMEDDKYLLWVSYFWTGRIVGTLSLHRLLDPVLRILLPCIYFKWPWAPQMCCSFWSDSSWP